MEFDVSHIPSQLRESLLHGKAAAEIGWGSAGDFDRCVNFLARHDVPAHMRKGECATLHHAATGKWPGAGRGHSGDVETFASEAHTGAMIALIPSAVDAQRLAMDGGEPVSELHMTLAFLGDSASWPQVDRLEMAAQVARAVGHLEPVAGTCNALTYFNPGDNGGDTALVYGVGGVAVEQIHRDVRFAINSYADRMPENHRPWVAHVTAAYTDDLGAHQALVERLGPVSFDTVRLAFGEEHYDIALQEMGIDLEAIVAAMGIYSPVTWRGPLAPIDSPTGDGRIFEAGRLTYQTFPAPLRFQRQGMPGHSGAVTVGRILHAEEGMWDGAPHIVGHGDWFNPDIIPEVTEAMALVEGGVAGPSVDLDTFAATPKEYQGKPVLSVFEGRVRGATLVSIPAFANLRLQLQRPPVADEPVDVEEVDDPSALVAAVTEFASVNSGGWKGAPVAPRDAAFDADDAVSRIEEYAGIGTDQADPAKLGKMFLWLNPDGTALGRDGYKLPWGDIFDGKPYLVYHAIYAAAALLEGGHGGLPNIPDGDKARLRSVISDIYAKLATEFNDPNVRASWDVAREKASQATKAAIMETETFAIQGGFDGMPIASGDPTWDKGAAERELDSWSGGDMSKYKRAFLYREDGADPKLKGSYKFPVARPINGRLTIIPAAVRNAAARVSNANVSDKAALGAAIERLMARIHKLEAGLIASVYDGVHPPKGAFAQRDLGGKTRMTVVPRDGYNEVYGHLANWDSCHLGLQIGNPNVCVKPPRSKRGYADFHVSTQLTAEGDIVEVGKLTIDAYHGSTRRGLTAAQIRAHYEHTGTEAAVGRVYEDEYGPVFFGVQVPDNDAALAQKIRRTPVSGHWHPVNGHLELVAALGVNRPAYPITASAADENIGEAIVLFDGDTQTGLIAGATFADEPEVQASDDDCGCDGTDGSREERIALLSGYQALPTHAELRDRRARLAAYSAALLS